MSLKPSYEVSFIYVKTNPYFSSPSYGKQPLLRKKNLYHRVLSLNFTLMWWKISKIVSNDFDKC